MQKKMPLEVVERQIIVVREERVILDANLAALYGVPTKVLNQAVRRNQARFPEDFMFQLTADEKAEVVTNCDHLQNWTPVCQECRFDTHGKKLDQICR